MATYHITIDERTEEGKELVSLLMKNKLVKFKENKKVSGKRTLNDVPVYTKAELKKRIAQAHRNQKAGRVITLKTRKDVSDFMRSL